MLKEVVVDVDEAVAGIMIETTVETILMHRKPATSVERRVTQPQTALKTRMMMKGPPELSPANPVKAVRAARVRATV